MAGHRIFATSFASIYPLYVQKAERKQRTRAEVHEVIEDPLMQKIRYLDKLVDELARGKRMESVLRQG
jgi:hypothetical protein